jgi:hypothetical protein
MARPSFRRAVLAAVAAAALLASPTTAGALTYDPPSWFGDGVAKVKARPGAKCPGPKPFTRTFNFPTDDGRLLPKREEGTTEDCLRRLPRALARTFPVLRPPGNDHPYREGCHGEFRHVTTPDDPEGNWDDETSFRCDIFSRPVIKGRPNPRTWFCWRSWWFHRAYETGTPGEIEHAGKPFWFAEETKYWRAQRFKRLSRCLNPKYRKPK